MPDRLNIKYYLLILLLSFSCKSTKRAQTYEMEDLKIIPITNNSFLHISYLDVPEYGRVACNGLIYMNKGEAVVFDTPVNDTASHKLIQWVTETKNLKLKAVVVNHFHSDCIAGIEVFHEAGIPSYANKLTALAITDKDKLPQNTFEDIITLSIGNVSSINRFLGEAHTKDNIVSYFPEEQLLFGGCMVKSLGAKKGNIEDANTSQWSNTIGKILENFPNIKIVVPGHGSHGDKELLKYTQQLFSAN